jgi:hypothetical protein
MKKNSLPVDDDEMPAEFDFSRSIPNPWFLAVHGPAYVRVIDKDLADLFPDNATMNAALRTIADAAQRTPAPARQKLSAKTATAPKKKARS